MFDNMRCDIAAEGGKEVTARGFDRREEHLK